LPRISRVISFLLLLVPYTFFWVFVVLNYLQVEGFHLWFLVVNTSLISVVIDIDNNSFLVHIGTIELVLLTSSLVLFYRASRDFILTLIFLFSTTLSVEIGTYFYLYQYFYTWVTSVQVFWHLPLITNSELLVGSIWSLAILAPVWLARRKIKRREQRLPVTQEVMNRVPETS
jgi:hypothetical protein